MNVTRSILLGLGLLLAVVGIYMLFFEAGLNRWVSVGVLTAGILVFIGLVVVGFASSAPDGGASGQGGSGGDSTTVVVEDDRTD